MMHKMAFRYFIHLSHSDTIATLSEDQTQDGQLLTATLRDMFLRNIGASRRIELNDIKIKQFLSRTKHTFIWKKR